MGQVTYDGLAIFGAWPKVARDPYEREAQVNTYFGLSGKEVLDGGSRGGKSVVTGWFLAPDAPTFNSLWTTAESYADNVPRTFVDATNRTYQQTRVLKFAPSTVLHRTASGGFVQGFKADLEHDI